MEKPKSYRVTWVIELDAESPVAAAELALKIQRDPESTATVFGIQDGDVIRRIDLSGLLPEITRSKEVHIALLCP